MLRTMIAGVVGLASLAAAGAARATVVVPADLTELARAAHVIVHGRVVSVQAQWADGRRGVETIVRLQASDYLKGDFGSEVLIRVPGGELGRYRSVMPGAPTFREGDEVVLFLGASPPSLPYVLGLSQGVFRLVRNPATGGTVVTPSPLVASATRVVRVQRGDPLRRRPTLEQFARQVRLIVAAERVRGTRERGKSPEKRVPDKGLQDAHDAKRPDGSPAERVPGTQLQDARDAKGLDKAPVKRVPDKRQQDRRQDR